MSGILRQEIQAVYDDGKLTTPWYKAFVALQQTADGVDTSISDQITIHNADAAAHAAFFALNFASDVYSPVLTNTLNITSSLTQPCQYLRVGSVVTVSGGISLTTTAPGASEIGVSVPIASNFANVQECGGILFENSTLIAGAVVADTANDRAKMTWTCGGGAVTSLTFIFVYRVI